MSSVTFGTYAPNPLQAALIRITRAMPEHWLGRRIAYFVRRILLWWFGDHPVDVETFGLRLRLYANNNVAEKRLLYTPQFFDFDERQALKQYLPSHGVFVDVGANAGGYSFFAAANTSPDAVILAVEPQPVMLERLAFNVQENKLSQKIRIIPCALSDRDGEMTLYTYADNHGEASLSQSMDRETHQGEIKVNVTTLLGMLTAQNVQHIDVIKLDAEGSEDLILATFFHEAPKTMLPKVILLEYAPARWRNNLRALIERNGYTMEQRTHLNVIFVRND